LHTIKVKKEAAAFSSDKERVWIDKNIMARVTFDSGNAELTRSISFESEEYAQKPFSINGRYLGDRLPKTVEVRGIGGHISPSTMVRVTRRTRYLPTPNRTIP